MIYCYRREDNGLVVEREFPIGEAPASLEVEPGVAAHRDIVSEGAPRIHMAPGRRGSKHGPAGPGLPTYQYSRAMGCGKKDVAKQNRFYRKNGVHPSDLEVMPDGAVKVGSRQALNKGLELHGMINMDGGYGDRTAAKGGNSDG